MHVRKIECVREREKEKERRIIRKTIRECSKKTGCTEILLPYLIPLSLVSRQDFLINTKMKERMLACERERERERESEKERARADRQITKRLNIIFLKITSVKIPL